MAQTIQFKRRIGTDGPPATGVLAAGEPAYNRTAAGIDNLYIGSSTGAAPHELVTGGPTGRQLERLGAQEIPDSSSNAKTFHLSNFKLMGGATGELLTTDGAGDLDWIAPGALGGMSSVYATAPLSPTAGAGATSGNPLTLAYQAPLSVTGGALAVEMADDADIDGGTDLVYPVSSHQLRRILGDPTTMSGPTGATGTIVNRVNQIYTALSDGSTIEVSTTGPITGSGLATSAIGLAHQVPLGVTGGVLGVTVESAAADITAVTPSTTIPVTASAVKGVIGDFTTLPGATGATSLVHAIQYVYNELLLGAGIPEPGATGSFLRGWDGATGAWVAGLPLSDVGDLTTLPGATGNTTIVNTINNLITNLTDGTIAVGIPEPATGPGWLRAMNGSGSWVAGLPLSGGTMLGTLTLNPTSQTGANDAAARSWVQNEIAAGQLFIGGWDVSTNTPDLLVEAAGPPLQGAYWQVTVSGTVPAGLPGNIAPGTTLNVGDQVRWNNNLLPAAGFERFPAGGMTQGEADLRYLQLVAGGTVTGNTTFNGQLTINDGLVLSATAMSELTTILAGRVEVAVDPLGSIIGTGATGAPLTVGTVDGGTYP